MEERPMLHLKTKVGGVRQHGLPGGMKLRGEVRRDRVLRGEVLATTHNQVPEGLDTTSHGSSGVRGQDGVRAGGRGTDHARGDHGESEQHDGLKDITLDEVQGVGGRWHDDAGGDHGVGLQAGEDDDARDISSSYKTSKEQKRDRGRCLEAQNLMMVQSNLVLFLATVIFDEDISSYPTFNMMGKEDIYGKMFQIPWLCNMEGGMIYLRVVSHLGCAAVTSRPATAVPVQSS
jgi:hypothetical protein